MTDEELIARLRLYGSKFHHEFGHNDAADRIEQLVATNEALIAENAKLHDHIEGVAKGIHKIMVGYEAKLAKVEAGLLAIAKRDEQMIWGEDYEVEEAFKDMRDIALATLAAVTETHKIKGESHE